MERVRRKMVRLLVISIGVTFLGLIAVLAAVVYRTANKDAAPAAGANLPVSIPAGSRVLETSLGDGQALLRVARTNGGEALLLVDLATGAVVATYPLDIAR